MNRFIFTIIMCLWLPAELAAQTPELDRTRVKDLLRSAAERYAPDRRVEWFNFDIDSLNNAVLIESTKKDALEEAERTLRKQFAGLQIRSRLLPDSVGLGQSKYALVNVSVTANRASPANSAEMVTQSLMGCPMLLLKRVGGFYLVRTPDSYISWVPANAVLTLNDRAFETWQRSPRMLVVPAATQAYSRASRRSEPVSDLVMGNIIVLCAKKGRFYNVQLPDGRKAYVDRKDLVPYSAWLSGAGPDGNNIIRSARALLGRPYLWGGTSSKALDCSGLTQTCYFVNGILIPRDASQQANCGKSIDICTDGKFDARLALKNLIVGDLLFFGNATGKVVHTGIYAGRGQFIHSSGMVKIGNFILGSADYDDHVPFLLAARRILDGGRSLRLADDRFYKMIND